MALLCGRLIGWLCRQMLLRKWRDVVQQELSAAGARARSLETRAWMEKRLVVQVLSSCRMHGWLWLMEPKLVTAASAAAAMVSGSA